MKLNTPLPNARPHEPSKEVWRRVLTTVIIALSVGYLLNVVLPDLGTVKTLIARVGIAQLISTVLLAAAMFLVSAYYNAHLLKRMGGLNVDTRDVFASYLQAQLVRYLPGKVWGLVYQARHLSKSIPSRNVILANLSQMLMTNLSALGVIASVLASAWWKSPWPLLALFPWMMMIELMHRNPRLEQWALIKTSSLLPSRFNDCSAVSIKPSKWIATGILIMEWLLYFAMILALLHGIAGPTDAMLLASWYAAASILALVAVIVPAGIAVREAIFVSAAPLLPVDSASLVGIAALLRICSVFAEILAALLGTFAMPAKANAS